MTVVVCGTDPRQADVSGDANRTGKQEDEQTPSRRASLDQNVFDNAAGNTRQPCI
jgi:hypothetical protein